jgi:uncharacterized membrane protein
VRPAKIELLAKVIAWRSFSMCYGFTIAYFFTHNLGESAGIVFMTGTTLTLLQWGFEIIWDKSVRSKLRHVISGQQGRINWLVRWRRDTRTLGVDEHEQGAERGKEKPDPLSPENAGREWT